MEALAGFLKETEASIAESRFQKSEKKNRGRFCETAHGSRGDTSGFPDKPGGVGYDTTLPKQRKYYLEGDSFM